ncbi:MAG: hypothetical protein Q8K65_01300 [Alphaproteobacteria bacterium]|nr:hypothetical protein [Alphaproteobacteria bacterium]
MPKYGTRLAVRLDSAAQRAILEVRSSETGEVVNQYPSEAQMRAFKQAASLDAAQQQAAARQQAAAPQPAPVSPRTEIAPQQQQTQSIAPVPQQQTQSIAPAPLPQQAAPARPNLQIAPSAPQTATPAPELSSGSSGSSEGVLV